MDMRTLEKLKKDNYFSKKIILNILFCLAICFSILVNIVLYYHIKEFLVANNWVVHTHRVIQAINNIHLNELNTVTRMRGYLITEENSFIQDMDKDNGKIIESFDYLKNFVSADSPQRENLRILGDLLRERIASIQKNIKMKKENKLSPSAVINLLNSGESLDSQIKLVIRNMNQLELVLLEKRNNDAKKSFHSAILLVIILNGITIFIMIIVIILFNNQLSRLKKSEDRAKLSEDLLHGIMDGTAEYIAALDLNFNLIAFNNTFQQEFKRIFGRRVVLGSNIKELLSHSPVDQKNAIEIWGRALKGEEFTVVGSFGDPKLSRNNYEITFSSIYDKQEKLIGASHIVRNIEARLRDENIMRESKEKSEKALLELRRHHNEILLINEMNSALLSASNINEVLSLIKKYCNQLLDFARGSLYVMNASRNYLEVKIHWNEPLMQEALILPDQCWGLRQGKVYRYLNSEKSISCSHRAENLSEVPYLCIPLLAQNNIIGLMYLEVEQSVLPEKEFKGEDFENHEFILENIMGHISLAIANISLREALKTRSIRDALTGLYNRYYFDEFFTKDLQRAQRQDLSLAVIMLDLDHFKNINDTFGHEAGDLILKEVGKTILVQIRKDDVPCRFGGDEFLIMFYDIDLENAFERCEKIRKEIGQIKIYSEGKLIGPLTASLGLALYPQHGSEIEVLLKAADQALYQSKKSSRNKVTIASA